MPLTLPPSATHLAISVLSDVAENLLGADRPPRFSDAISTRLVPEAFLLLVIDNTSGAIAPPSGLDSPRRPSAQYHESTLRSLDINLTIKRWPSPASFNHTVAFGPPDAAEYSTSLR
jgi:hypothetical protein